MATHEGLVFQVGNHHVASCGEPPKIVADGKRYHSYFENTHGEQWVFIYDYETERGELRGGDAGWGNVHEVTFTGDDRVGAMHVDIVLDKDERAWLLACGAVIQGYRSHRDGVRAQKK